MRPRLAAVTFVAALALVGCSAGDDAEVGEGLEPAATDDAADPGDDPVTDPGEGTATDEEGQPAVPGGGPSPEPDECVDIPESEDGLYTIADAGTVMLGVENGRLYIGDVEPAAGWDHRVTDDEGDEVEIEFRREGVQLELEVKHDDGRVELTLCRD